MTHINIAKYYNIQRYIDLLLLSENGTVYESVLADL